jgi:hypothetical protein
MVFMMRKSRYICNLTINLIRFSVFIIPILRICVTKNISKTVSNIKSMYYGITRRKGGTEKKKVCYYWIFMHVQRMYYFSSSSSHYNLMSREIFYRSSRFFSLFPAFSIIDFFFSTPGAA